MKELKLLLIILISLPMLCVGQEGHVTQLANGLTSAGLSAGTVGPSSTFYGNKAGRTSTGSANTAIGSNAGEFNGSNVFNTFLGASAGYSTTGSYNFYAGTVAGANSSGSNNVFTGFESGRYNSGSNNVFSGSKAGYNNTQSGAIYIGYESGYTNNSSFGGSSVVIGDRAGRNSALLRSSVFIGALSGYNAIGYDSMFLGNSAGYNATGSNNLFLGNSAGYNAGGSSNIFLGSQAGYSETGSHKLYIENSNSATPLIYGKFDTDQVGINTTNIPLEFSFAVKGKVITEEIKVALEGTPGVWPDYVFNDAYDLPSLNEVEAYINQQGHLMDIPSANEVSANGIFLGEMNAKLLRKIEELTLYAIQQQKEIEMQTNKNKELEERLVKLEKLLNKSN